MTLDALQTRVAAVDARVRGAEVRAGRSPGSVQLVAVSKLHPAEIVEAGWQSGLRHFGENYAQELRDKHQALGALAGLTWHAIGPVQVKNAKYVARAASYFHALVSVEVARELSRTRGLAGLPPLRCLIEVNVAGEASKAGVGPAEVPALLDAARALPSLEVVGLSTMPPLVDEPEHNRGCFRELAALGRRFGLPHLSMGTTSDFEVAIEEGATFVRVGTALFGERAPG